MSRRFSIILRPAAFVSSVGLQICHEAELLNVVKDYLVLITYGINYQGLCSSVLGNWLALVKPHIYGSICAVFKQKQDFFFQKKVEKKIFLIFSVFYLLNFIAIQFFAIWLSTDTEIREHFPNPDSVTVALSIEISCFSKVLVIICNSTTTYEFW